MFSVASLLNPAVKKEPRSNGSRRPSSPSSSSLYTTSPSPYGSPLLSTRPNIVFKQKMTKDGAVFVKGKTKGTVNYPPFDRLDEKSTQLAEKFEVKYLGAIWEYARHIPYNSEKKTFLDKTGRESFEVFQYEFKIPGDDKVYTVMWDYNNGLVRITPFFKCCKYSKTTPAKMLNMNPGLKDITHSITGGALVAQGYWMPYSCAQAVCATFCSHIAGALIPIFGPDFPSQCVPPEAPEHGRMIIDPSIISAAAEQAEQYRRHYSNQSSKNSTRDSYSPQQRDLDRTPGMQTPSDVHFNKRLRLKRTLESESPYTDNEVDCAGSETSGEGYFSPSSPSPRIIQRPTYRQQNALAHNFNSSRNFNISPIGPNPLLTAVPRSMGFSSINAPSHTGWSHKRTADEIDADDEYESNDDKASMDNTKYPPSTTSEEKGEKSESVKDDNNNNDNDNDVEMLDPETSENDRKAAYLLLHLHLKDRDSSATTISDLGEGPRIKRLRATSM
ncbi:APSES transcription factor Xbp1 [Phlyctema vagabunda]|uniref:APSES transcription factor Xbp1 n=1 Tax=Phlyctema vagabunda TaxID=108571 RepID=A0ABR4PCM6_9HELO